MESVDNEILEFSTDLMAKARKDGKPLLLWLNPTRMHIFTKTIVMVTTDDGTEALSRCVDHNRGLVHRTT